MPSDIGEWKHRGKNLRFDEETEKVLKADDYVMRYYFSPRVWVNFYAGYYGSQRAGATYHSPLNCLPGTGWELKDPQTVEIRTPSGRNFLANRYIVERGDSRQILVYWYHGRGRSTASEYKDKLYTSLDSLAKRRSDGALVRLMSPVTDDEEKTLAGLLDFASQVGDELSPYVPD
jgi:EpsI family protein